MPVIPMPASFTLALKAWKRANSAHFRALRLLKPNRDRLALLSPVLGSLADFVLEVTASELEQAELACQAACLE